jgi:molecular chaperone IbpA
MLVITGRRANENRNKDGNFLHVGIATRAFERRFELADFVRVTSADLADGLLTIELVREIPEAMKPRKVEIGGGEPQRTTIENNAQPANDMQEERQAQTA